jgi:hypothetical protein
MANNYMDFSEMIGGLTTAEKAWIEKEIRAGSELFPDPEEEEYLHFEHKIDRDNWWLYSEESFDPDQLATAVQAFLATFRPDQYFTMTWAEYCSKPRIGEFGGGWMVVTADDVKMGGTWTSIGDEQKELSEGGGTRANIDM